MIKFNIEKVKFYDIWLFSTIFNGDENQISTEAKYPYSYPRWKIKPSAYTLDIMVLPKLKEYESI